MESSSTIKWVGAIGGGLFVFLFATLVSSFFLRNMAPPPLDIVGGLILPLLIGLLAGVHTCLSHVRKASKKRRSFRLDLGERPDRTRGLCIHCGYDLRGTTSGVCSECGQEIVKR